MRTIAVCSERGHPEDRRTWSGTPSNLIPALRELGVEVIAVGPLGSWRRRLLTTFSSVTSRLGRRVNWDVEPVVLRFLGRCLLRAVSAHRVDAVVTMGWYPLLPPRQAGTPPVFYYGDAPMSARIDHSPFWSGISRRTRRLAVPTEIAALRSLDGAVMSSQWALQGLLDSCAIEPHRVRYVPFGANIADPGPISRRRPDSEVRLLSVGVQWKRKGLDTAVLTADTLRARGVACSIDVVGVEPPDPSWQRPYVRFHGFLDTRSPEARESLAGLYRDADLFLLPTTYDPSPIVLSEAQAYALPIVVTAVNGITERVTEQGVLVPPGSGPEQYADAVEEALERYEALSTAARAESEGAANWSHSAAQLLEQIQSIQASSGS